MLDAFSPLAPEASWTKRGWFALCSIALASAEMYIGSVDGIGAGERAMLVGVAIPTAAFAYVGAVWAAWRLRTRINSHEKVGQPGLSTLAPLSDLPGGAIDYPRDRPRSNGDWLVKVEREEWWDCGDRGLVAAIHVSARNRNPCGPAFLSEFDIRSGALDWRVGPHASPDERGTRVADLEQAMRGKSLFPSGLIDPRYPAEGWIPVAFLHRFTGGRPGYVLVPKENPHNWRGYERVCWDPPYAAGVRRGEANQIATELSALMNSSGWIVDEVKNVEAMYDRDPANWDSNLGGHEAALQKLFKQETESYVSWAQLTTAYLRDRVGRQYEFRFAAAGEWGTVGQRLERHRAVLELFIPEFRALGMQLPSPRPV